MKIFLSYSSRDRALAEEVHLALLEHGHDVFFDRADLPAGDSFHDRIREEIFERQLFLFLASRNSLRQGSYCLTELKFCRERWPHPRRRVLTVLIDDLAADELPPYLRAVGVLRPEGNLAAETAAAVAVLTRRVRLWKGLAGLTAVLAAGLGVAWGAMQQPDASIEIVTPQIAPLRRGLGSGGDTYVIRGKLVNRGRAARQVTATTLEPGPPLRVDAALPEASVPREWNLAPGEAREFALPVEVVGGSLPAQQLMAFEWIVRCAVFESDEVRSRPASWLPGAQFEFQKAIPLPASTRHRLRAVSVDPLGSEFLVAADEPCSLARLSAQGSLETLLLAPGQPLALAAAGDYAVLGTTAQLPLYAYQFSTRSALEPLEIPQMHLALENDERPISTSIRELAVHEGWIWVLTGRENEAAGFVGIGPQHNAISRPLFLEDFERTWGLRLRTLDGVLWGVDSGTSPGSLFEFFELFIGGYQTFAGSDVVELACATDIAERPGEGFLLLNCDEDLVEVKLFEGRIVPQRILARVPLPDCGRGCWRDTRLATTGQRILLAATTFQQDPWTIVGTHLFAWEPATGIELILEAPGWETKSIATTAERGVVVLRSPSAQYDSLEIRY